MDPLHWNITAIWVPVVTEQYHVAIGGINKRKGLGPGFIEREQETRIILCLRSHLVR